MKRHVCTVAAGLALVLVGAGPAAAGLPGLGGTQTAAQSSIFGDQAVEEQQNDADVTQKQGNGNVSVSPAVSVFGDASTTNEQGSGNTAKTDVDQSNSATQSQSADQGQSLEQNGSGGSCCDGQSQAGEQKVYGGDQTVDEQRNDADVSQYQGNGNVNVSPALSVFGDASTSSSQGSHNVAKADVDQSNTATQTQSSSQSQRLAGSGGCCKRPPVCGYDARCAPHDKHDKKEHGRAKERCCDGQSQAGEQKVYGGDQTVGEQRNDADVSQYQGNGNVNVSPAVALFGKQHDGCRSKCHSQARASHDGGATTGNVQGSGNRAYADAGQSNRAEQAQSATQWQKLVERCKGVMR